MHTCMYSVMKRYASTSYSARWKQNAVPASTLQVHCVDTPPPSHICKVVQAHAGSATNRELAHRIHLACTMTHLSSENKFNYFKTSTVPSPTLVPKSTSVGLKWTIFTLMSSHLTATKTANCPQCQTTGNLRTKWFDDTKDCGYGRRSNPVSHT